MSRYATSYSYGHACRYEWGVWTISWVVDFYYEGTRGRFPRRFRRETTEAGAKRFCKKHKIDFPAPGD